MKIPETFLNRTKTIDSLEGIKKLPNNSVHVVVTSPPYWGQRDSLGIGIEENPRDYLRSLMKIFKEIYNKLNEKGIVWVNIGDSYNTPINWRKNDYVYSTLGADQTGHNRNNSAYTKKRIKRKAYIDKNISWLKYGNMLALPQRLIIEMVNAGYYFRGEVIWSKEYAMPEGNCRRPHRTHEQILLFSKNERHNFQISPPIKSVWNIQTDKTAGIDHCSKYPIDLPYRCIEAYGRVTKKTVVLDPFSGSGTTGLAAKAWGCTFVGFEIDPERTKVANSRYRKFDVDKFFRESFTKSE